MGVVLPAKGLHIEPFAGRTAYATKLYIHAIRRGKVGKTMAKKEATKTTTKAFFDTLDNFTITDVDSIRRIVQEYNALTDKEKTMELVKKIERKIADYSASCKNVVLAPYAKIAGADLFKALFTLEVQAGKTDKATKKSVYNAIKCKQYTFKVDKDGKAFVKASEKALTLADIHARKAEIIADKNADGKVKKEDKDKALLDILNADNIGIVSCFIRSACDFESITLKAEPNKDTLRMFGEIGLKYNENGKENPFTLNSKTAAQNQLREVVTVLAGEEVAKKFMKNHALALYKRTCYIDKKCGEVIATPLQVLQDLAIIARYAFNDIDLTMEDKSGLFTPDKTENESIIA